MTRIIRICFIGMFGLFMASIAISGDVVDNTQANVSSGMVGEIKQGDSYKDDLIDVTFDPDTGFEVAIKNNDLRFAAILVGGYAPHREVPGLDEKAKNDRLEEKYGTKIIADVSGDVIDEDFRRRQTQKDPAEKYAEKYNQLLLEKIRSENK